MLVFFVRFYMQERNRECRKKEYSVIDCNCKENEIKNHIKITKKDICLVKKVLDTFVCP